MSDTLQQKSDMAPDAKKSKTGNMYINTQKKGNVMKDVNNRKAEGGTEFYTWTIAQKIDLTQEIIYICHHKININMYITNSLT